MLVNYNYLLNFRTREQLAKLDDAGRAHLLPEILARDPSDEAWHAICELFAGWPEGEEKDRNLLVADRALDAWDPRLRYLTSSWRHLYQDGRLASVARLVRSVKLYRREANADRELRAIVQSELARSVTYLTIFKCELSSGAFESLAKSPHLGCLQHLEIKKTILSDVDVQHLMQAGGLSQLRLLKLIDVGLNADSVRQIGRSIALASLEGLDFSHNVVGSEGLTTLSQASWLSSIRTLALCHNYIRDDGVNDLMRSSYIESLRLLDLSGNPITELGRLREWGEKKGVEIVA